MLRIYEKDLTADQLSTALATNGLGPLNWAQAARCHRVINGDWSLSLTYPLGAPGADLLLPERLICYEDDVTGEEQLYRISRRTPRTTRQGRVIDIEAPHVVYDLRHKFITNIETTEDERYPDGVDAETALTQLLDGTGFSVGEVSVDPSRLDYLDVLQKDVMSCIKEQLLDRWGGELIFDNFTVHLVAAMGQDRRYPIRDGRNIEAITITEDYDKVVTRLHVRGYDGANFEEINDGCDFIDSKLIGQYSHIREGYADFSDEDDPQALMDLGLAELARRELPEITYDIRLAQMQGSVQYAAYKRLETYGLGDTAVLSTQALSKPVILRCSELETDCLTGRNLTVKLGNADRELLASITSGASAADRLAHVLDSQGNLQAEKLTGKLNLVRIKNLEAEVARIAEATLKDAKIDVAQIQNLSAEVAKIIVANIGEMHVDWAQIESLTAAMSELIKTRIGEADIDWSHIKDLITDTSIITQGEAGKLYIADLAVTEANMVSLSVGELLVRGQDGAFYAVSVGEDGRIVTERKEVTGSDIADKTINGGKKLIEGSITAGTLNVKDIFADSEIVRELIAANINVDTLFAREAVLHAMEAMDIRGNEYLQLTVKEITETASTAKNTATAAARSMTVEYYLSDSTTALTGGEWSAIAPAWTAGKYMWSRTATTDGAGKTTTSAPTCIAGAAGRDGAQGPQGPKGETGAAGATGSQGATGAPGKDGAAGKGVKAITNYYLSTASASGVTASTGGWTTAVQSVSAAKKYLWNYEVVTYTDNSTVPTSPCIIGAYGDQGATGSTGPQGEKGATGATGAAGKGIASIAEHYAVSSSNVTAPTSWQETVPTLTAANKYLWNYETISYTTGSPTDTTKRVIGVYGDKGATGSQGATGAPGKDGATGKGVKSIQAQYYLSTSKTSQSGGSWVTTPPEWVQDKYMWTRSLITYTDNTTATTTPYCDTGWEAANGIQVGGRNFWSNSSFDNGIGSYHLTLTEGSIEVIEKAYLGHNAVSITRSNYTGTTRAYLMEPSVIKEYKAGDSFILHAWVYIDAELTANNNNIMVRGSAGDRPSIAITPSVETKKWIHLVSDVFTAATDGSFQNCFVLLGANGSMRVSQIMFEKATKPSDWTPAPEDMDEEIGRVSERVTTTESSITELAGKITAKADQTTVDDILQDMSSAKVDIDGVAAQIGMAVEQLQRVQGELTDKVSAGQLEGRFAELSMGLEGLNIALGSLTDVESKVGALVDFQRRYDATFHFLSDGLLIHTGDTLCGMRLAGDGVHLLSETGAEVAYINGYRMYITSVEITGSLTMGRYCDMVLANGALVTVFNG